MIRKFMHVGICAIYLFLIYTILWYWVLVILLLGAVFMYCIRKSDFIKAIRSVRSSKNFGEYYLFIGLAFSTLWYGTNEPLIEITIIVLTLGLGDTFASIAKHKITNSIILTVICAGFLIIFDTNLSIMFTSVLLSFLFVVNWLSKHGIDNITIPLTLIICFSLL